MTDRVETIGDVSVLLCSPDGPALATEADATDLVGHAFAHPVEVIALPIGRLTDEFFVLRSGLAGAIVQKFATYRFRFVVIGDVSAHVATSTALRDFVTEANRGNQTWFVADEADLRQRLAA